MTSSDDFYEVPSYPLAPFPSGSMPVKPRFFKVAMESSCPKATAMCCVESSEPWDLHEYDYRQSTSARIVDQSVILCFLFAVRRTVAVKSWYKLSLLSEVQSWSGPGRRGVLCLGQLRGCRDQTTFHCAIFSPHERPLGQSFLFSCHRLFQELLPAKYIKTQMQMRHSKKD